MITSFELSRIYADGWNAANALPMGKRDALVDDGAAPLNPWPPTKERERARWAEGFGRAMAQAKHTPFRPSLTARRSR